MQLAVRTLLLFACACPVYPVERREAAAQDDGRQILLNSKERKSLIGHLQGLEGRKLVLTERQKLALKQELNLQGKGFDAFSSASDKEEQKQNGQTSLFEFSRNSPQFSEISPANSQQQSQSRFAANPSQNRFTPPHSQGQRISDASSSSFSTPRLEQHPEVLLNKLSPEQKQLFQDQFNKLSQELQNFSYNKFISSSPDIQVYAITQFLSLNTEQLAESIKREKDKETKIPETANQQNSQIIPQPLFRKHSQTSFTKTQPQRQTGPRNSNIQSFNSNTFRATASPTSRPQQAQPLIEKELQLFQAEASRADQLALKQQVEALKDIIAQQSKINSSQ